MSIKEDLSALCKDVQRIELPEGFSGVELFDITYESDGNMVKGYAAAPMGFEGTLRAVVYNRGGNREFGTLQPRVICKYASRGFFAIGGQYRGNAGGTGREQFGGEDVNDVIKLIDISLDLPFTDRQGVFMSGHSRGGMMTYICCKRDGRITAAAVGAGVTDCLAGYERREDSMKQVFLELVGGTPDELPEEYKKRSAVCWADEIKVPLFIGHGDDDWRVDVSDSIRMDELLTSAGKPHKLKIYPGADHSLLTTSYFDDVIEWFRSFM